MRNSPAASRAAWRARASAVCICAYPGTCGGQGQAVGAHRGRSARQRARRAPVEELMPGTWRA